MEVEAQRRPILGEIVAVEFVADYRGSLHGLTSSRSTATTIQAVMQSIIDTAAGGTVVFGLDIRRMVSVWIASSGHKCDYRHLSEAMSRLVDPVSLVLDFDPYERGYHDDADSLNDRYALVSRFLHAATGASYKWETADERLIFTQGIVDRFWR